MPPPIVPANNTPNVPAQPGVPPLNRVGNVIATGVLLAADIASALRLFGPPQWGLYLNGVLTLFPDTITRIEGRQQWEISDYQQEQGAFASYNKVERPFDFSITMAKGGSEDDRAAFFYDVKLAASTLDLYDIVMPDAVYLSACIDSYDFRRTCEDGVGLVSIDIKFTQVRVTGTSEFVSTAEPSGADPQSTGTVPPVAVSDRVSTGIAGGV